MTPGPLNLLRPLDLFYAKLGLPLPDVERVLGSAIPQPYKRLLVHERDMTSTLERFHKSKIHLRLLERSADSHSISRLVALVLDDSEKPVEFGAIIIHLQHLPEGVRESILECQTPLGAILGKFHVRFMSCPQAFVRVESDRFMNEALGLTESQPLYGRRNNLLLPNHAILADILEILPPEDAAVGHR